MRGSFKDRKATKVARTSSSHNLPTNRARELIEHSKAWVRNPTELRAVITCRPIELES